MTVAFKRDCPVYAHGIFDVNFITTNRKVEDFAFAQLEVVSKQYFYFGAEVSFLGLFCLIQRETVGARRVDNLINRLSEERWYLD